MMILSTTGLDAVTSVQNGQDTASLPAADAFFRQPVRGFRRSIRTRRIPARSSTAFGER